MKYRKLGKNGDMVSVLGYGCMRLPILNNSPANINEAEAIKQIRYGIDNGINYIDTAYPYHMGKSELVVAKALKSGYREKVFLADKLPTWLIKEPSDMDKYLDRQLDKLEVSCIDFYLIHTLDKKKWDNCLKNDLFGFIKRAKERGKINQIGFSFHDEFKVFKEITDSYDWDFCQIQLNYMDENFQAGLKGLKYAGEKNLDVIIMEPLRGGVLARNIPDDVAEIWKSSGYERTPAAWAFQYLWNFPEVSTVLSGMNSISQIAENINEAENVQANSLTDEENKTIEKVKKAYKSRSLIDCTGCRYCMPCPHGVDIPECFATYNNANMYNDFEFYKNHYLVFITDKEKPNNCIKCGVCEESCPQHLPIMDLLDKVRNEFGK